MPVIDNVQCPPKSLKLAHCCHGLGSPVVGSRRHHGWFKVEERFVPETGKTKLVFGMTDTALALTSQLGAQCELQRPFMAPMICEPQDFEYLDPQPLPAA